MGISPTKFSVSEKMVLADDPAQNLIDTMGDSLDIIDDFRLKIFIGKIPIYLEYLF